MSAGRKRLLAGFSIFVLTGWAVWLLVPAPRTALPPDLAKLVAKLRWQEPWYFRLLKRTHTLRFLPKRWLADDYPAWVFGTLGEFRQLGTNAWAAMPELVDLVKQKNLEIAVPAAQALAAIKSEQHPDWGRALYGQKAAARTFDWMYVLLRLRR